MIVRHFLSLGRIRDPGCYLSPVGVVALDDLDLRLRRVVRGEVTGDGEAREKGRTFLPFPKFNSPTLSPIRREVSELPS